MPVKRLSRTVAADLVRHCLSAGRVIPGRHFKEELANEGLDILDAHNVLRTGNIFQEPEPDIRSGDWKYRMEGTDLDTLTKATERMTQAEIKLQEAAQKAQSPAGGPPGGDTGGRPSGNPNEKVVDAEFEEA